MKFLRALLLCCFTVVVVEAAPDGKENRGRGSLFGLQGLQEQLSRSTPEPGCSWKTGEGCHDLMKTIVQQWAKKTRAERQQELDKHQSKGTAPALVNILKYQQQEL
mmetsp:Transcript_52231/g.93697  ORF Transcript_52231/g.93697 Transcript_52231/m.93697 type:complete len:106 (-) Transcript_52231:27-344(-)